MSIESDYKTTKNKIKQFVEKYNRDPRKIHLLAVSKGRTIEEIKKLIRLGQHDFAESYVQEAVIKINQLVNYSLIWHFIGKMQSNKIKEIAKWFDWVHSVDSLKKAQILDQFRDQYNLPPINICIQVNVAESLQKGGLYIEEVDHVIHNIQLLDNLKLRGFMTIIDQKDSFIEQKKLFGKLTKLFKHYQEQGFLFDVLSMGMSNDYEAAIASNATMLRIGTDLFGAKATTLLYNEEPSR